jgi:hypothetical protein
VPSDEELIDFVRARVREDETFADLSESPAPWYSWVGDPVQEGEADVYDDHGNRIGIGLTEGDAAHAARWHPNRVRAEVAKNRAILDTVVGGRAADPMYALLQLLAAPFAGHPDYRAEWRSS